MINIVIFSGGTGSIAIQEGFSTRYGIDSYNLDVIINGYDNGKSTGACRKIFNDRILGPSDLRKNHMIRFKARNAARLGDPFSREYALYRLFDLRFDADDKEEYYAESCKLLEECTPAIGEKDTSSLKSLLDYFFLFLP